MEQSINFNPEDKTLADIDFDKFNDMPRTDDLKIIDECLDKHFHILDTLKSRQQRLKNIQELYPPRADLQQTMSALIQMNNIGVTHDVVKALFTDEAPYVSKLNMKHCQILLPKCQELMESKTGYFVKVGIDGILNTLRHIGPEII